MMTMMILWSRSCREAAGNLSLPRGHQRFEQHSPKMMMMMIMIMMMIMMISMMIMIIMMMMMIGSWQLGRVGRVMNIFMMYYILKTNEKSSICKQGSLKIMNSMSEVFGPKKGTQGLFSADQSDTIHDSFLSFCTLP